MFNQNKLNYFVVLSDGEKSDLLSRVRDLESDWNRRVERSVNRFPTHFVRQRTRSIQIEREKICNTDHHYTRHRRRYTRLFLSHTHAKYVNCLISIVMDKDFRIFFCL